VSVLDAGAPPDGRDLPRASGARWRITRWQWFTLTLLAALLLVAVLAPWLAPYNPNATHPLEITAAPSLHHLLGTDNVGRDILSRIIYGSRISLFIGVVSTVLSLVLGGVIGSLAVATGKLGDAVIMRCMDVLMAFPAILLAVVWAATIGTGVLSLLLIISILHVPQFARIVRGLVRDEIADLYVAAERSLGAVDHWIIRRHVLRNVVGPVAVFAALMVADAIALEAAMSFIGLGISPPTASWGNIVADGQGVLLSGAWWPITYGGLAIVGAVLLFTVVSEQLGGAARMGRRLRAWRWDAGASSAAQRPTGEILPVAAPREAPPGRPTGSSGQNAQVTAWTAPDDSTLSVQDLSIRFPHRYGHVDVVSGVSFDVASGEILGVVGESGCGKTLVGLAVMGLLPPGAVVSGQVVFGGRNLLSLGRRERRAILGSQIAMVYQDALSSLNPTMPVGRQLRDVCRLGSRWSPAELLELVGLSDTRRILHSYPIQLSGGQRQRILIALALSRGPRLIIADEPTTALDVTVQAQILQLIGALQHELGFSMVLISHDLALIRQSADRVLVLYAGRNAELGPTDEITRTPSHPYTCGLIASIASLELAQHPAQQIPGSVPGPTDFAAGCRFSGRCSQEGAECAQLLPQPRGERGHVFACHHPIEAPVPAPATTPEHA
jgi:peptide/nickel transport system permease protein